MPSWESRLLSSSDALGLQDAVDAVLAQQLATWPLLQEGRRALAEAETKRLGVSGLEMAVRHIPHRMKSTTARVDAASIRARPCFLCLANLPEEQRGVGFGEWVVLANPFPILDKHLTIVHREHTPQRLTGRAAALLALAEVLPDSFVIYNGPECGASAPDHFHFQACERSLFPLEAAVSKSRGPVFLEHPARPIVLVGEDARALAGEIDRVSDAVATVTGKREHEPLLNVAAFWHAGRFTACIFPRRKHRPDAFHRGELLVSPATIDLSGVLVAPRHEDFERLDGELVRAIHDEVSLPATDLAAVAHLLGWKT